MNAPTVPLDKRIKVLCLVDGVVQPPDRWLWNQLPEWTQADQVDFISTPVVDGKGMFSKFFRKYLPYMRSAVVALFRSMKGYDVVVGWEAKVAFPLAVLRSLFGIKHPPLVVLDFNLKGISARYRWLGQFGVKSIDRGVVTNSSGIERYMLMTGASRDKFALSQLGWRDVFADLPPNAADIAKVAVPDLPQKYIFAGGRSERDYATFIQAVQRLDFPVIINARPFNVSVDTLPEGLRFVELEGYAHASNASVVTTFLLQHAYCVVVPLKPATPAAGHIFIIQAMCAGRPVIASRTGGADDYIEHEKTGLLVDAGDVAALRDAIQYLVDNPEKAEAMGCAGRKAWEASFTAEAAALRNYMHIHEVATNFASQRSNPSAVAPTR